MDHDATDRDGTDHDGTDHDATDHDGTPTEAGPVRTLVCDDQPAVRRLLRTVLERTGRFEVVAEAGDGREAADQAAVVQPDLVLLDLSMPNVSGLEAIPLVRAAAPGTVVVVVSAHLSEAVEDEILSAGAAGFVDKGRSVETLLDGIDAALGG